MPPLFLHLPLLAVPQLSFFWNLLCYWKIFWQNETELERTFSTWQGFIQGGDEARHSPLLDLASFSRNIFRASRWHIGYMHSLWPLLIWTKYFAPFFVKLCMDFSCGLLSLRLRLWWWEKGNRCLRTAERERKREEEISVRFVHCPVPQRRSSSQLHSLPKR